jgi:hypothetical protein
MGLSSLHISRWSGPDRDRSRAAVLICEDGSLAKVRREHVSKVCVSCGAEFYTLARREHLTSVCASCKQVLKVCECGREWYDKRYPKDEEGRSKPVYCPSCGLEYEGDKRSVVSRFSEASRRRLMQTLAQLKKGIQPCFVTLTYPDSWDGHNSPDEWKKSLKRFEERFRRAFPGACYIWRREVVDRKSGERFGELSPHYHLLVFGVEYNRLRAFVPGQWYEAVGTKDPKHLAAGTQVAKVISRRGIMSYASKAVGVTMSSEMGKQVQAAVLEDAEGPVSLGRWWGCVLVENFESLLSEVVEYILEETEAVRVVRAFRRLAQLRSRDYPSLLAFIDGAWLKKNLARLAVPDEGMRCYRASGRRYDVSFSVFMGAGQ